MRIRDDETQLLLRQINDFCLGVTSEQSVRNLFNDIGQKIQFHIETEWGIIPFKVLGVVKDYNGVDITQTPNYIKILRTSYINHMLKLHGCDT